MEARSRRWLADMAAGMTPPPTPPRCGGEGSPLPPASRQVEKATHETESASTSAANEAPLRRNGEGLGRGRSIYAAARDLRPHQTPAEARLWSALRRDALGVPFRRQHPIGPFVVDFCCLPRKLIVEVDGSVHDREDVREQDEWREAWLTSHGFRVVRFTNDDITDRLEAVIDSLRTILAEQHAILAADWTQTATENNHSRPSASPSPPQWGGVGEG